jgi:hypothetical protein
MEMAGVEDPAEREVIIGMVEVMTGMEAVTDDVRKTG